MEEGELSASNLINGLSSPVDYGPPQGSRVVLEVWAAKRLQSCELVDDEPRRTTRGLI